jgi:hypothetical protein
MQRSPVKFNRYFWKDISPPLSRSKIKKPAWSRQQAESFMLSWSSAYSSVLKMEETYSSETSVFSTGLHGITSQKIELLTTAAVRTQYSTLQLHLAMSIYRTMYNATFLEVKLLSAAFVLSSVCMFSHFLSSSSLSPPPLSYAVSSSRVQIRSFSCKICSEWVS